MESSATALPGAASGLTLRQLRIFASVARHLSFTGAAQELYITQPSVSAAIAELERYLGTQLLVRTTRTVSLTAEGKILQDLADWLLWQVHATEMLMRQGDRNVHGELTVGTDSTCGTYAMPALLGAFKTRYPSVEVRMEILNRAALLDNALARKYDLAIASGPVDTTKLQATPFALHELVMIAPPDHPLVVCRDIPLQALSNQAIILREEGSGIRHGFEELMAAAGIPITPALSLGSSEAVKRAVQHRLGLAPMSRLAITDDLHLGRLALLDVEGFPQVRQWYLVQRPGDDSALLRTLRQFLLDNVKHIIQCPTTAADLDGDVLRSANSVPTARDGTVA